METRVLTVNPVMPEEEAIAEAADVLRRGGLVAFPTETVYGLGANALDADAVASIFAAKGRPPTNPVIVHVSDVAAARRIVTRWPETAERLAHRFWPGPLTLVLPKTDDVPDVVTGGGPTVAVRAPSHPVAAALLRRAGLPVAAPSANRSAQVSPTRASHVLRSLSGRFDLLLDGGACPGGIESTVLDLTTTPPRLLRPGLVTRSAIEAVTGPIDVRTSSSEAGPLPSPGMMARHYAPDASLELSAYGEARVAALLRAGLRVGWMRLAGPAREIHEVAMPTAVVISMPNEPAAYASRLYDALHALDDAGVDRIVVDGPADTPEWSAIWDRLRRAAAPR